MSNCTKLVLYREMDIADGPWSWGYLVNKTTNSFNGMIGMVQRRVNNTCNSLFFYFIILLDSGGTISHGNDNFDTPT